MSTPIFLLSPAWDAEEQITDTTNGSVQLGDGYSIANPGSLQSRTTWNLTRNGLTTEEVTDIVEQLQLWGGVTAFSWSPHEDIPKRQYFCSEWKVNPLGFHVWSIDLTLTEDTAGQCLSFGALVDTDEIIDKFTSAATFLDTFTDDTGNYLINSTNNLALRTLHNHSEQIPDDCGRLYEQLVLALGAIAVYEATEDDTWLTRATGYTQAIVDSYYNSDPDDGSTYLPHWLINVDAEQLEDIYPTSRTLSSGEVNTPLGWLPMLWELYEKLYEYTEAGQWNTLALSTKADAIEAATFSNQSFIYRKNSGSPTEYPGTQITGTATRISSGTFDRYARASGSVNLVVENLSVQTAIQSDTTYVVEAGSNQANRVIEFFVSTSTDDASEISIYRQFWRLGSSGSANTRTIASSELKRWDDLAWFYGVGLVSGTANYESQEIDDADQVVLRLEAAATLNLNSSARNPFKLNIRVVTNPATLRLQDFEGRYWDYALPVSNWTLREPTWSNFTWSPANISAQGSITPSTNGNIQSLQILTTGTVYLWWIGNSAPTPLPVPAIAYRSGVRDRGNTSRELYVGDVYPTNSVLDTLTYTPGVVPFARNIEDGVAGNLTGLPYAAYQNPYGFNQTTRLANILSFLEASQAAYAATTGDTGPLAPVYTWNDINNRSQGETVNRFGFNGFDNLDDSGEYQAQIGLWLAKAWNSDRSNSRLANLAMSWIQWFDQVYSPRYAVLPPTAFTTNLATPGNNPGVQALIGEAAIYCNLAGGDPASTFRCILRSLQYLDSQFVASGAMAGSWSFGQPVFASTLKQYYSWWHGACLSFCATLVAEKPEITYPPCSEPLTIGTSQPIPEICCGARVIRSGPGWNCVGGVCVYTESGSFYATQAECEAARIPIYGESPYSFTGGQSPGVTYRLFWRVLNTGTNTYGAEVSPGTLVGPVTYFPGDPAPSSGCEEGSWYSGSYRTASGSGFAIGIGDGCFIQPPFSGLRLAREDGLPDTGGNPPAIITGYNCP